MQFVDAKPIIERMRAGLFEESEVGPYFTAWVWLGFIPSSSSAGLLTFLGALDWLVGVIGTLVGLSFVKAKNGGTFGDLFLTKLVVFGWITMVRIYIFAIPIAAAGLVVTMNYEWDRQVDLAVFCLSFIAFAYFFWSVGGLIAEVKKNHNPTPTV